MMALLLVLHVGAVAPEQHVPAPIPYGDCLELAVKVARYYDHTMSHNHPEVYCEIQS